MKKASIIGIFFSIVLCSCVTTKFSTIITGTTRPAISPNEVKIYIEPPAKYETIGLIDATREVSSSRQKTQDRIMEDLKFQVAKMGGNGLILTGTGNQSSGGVLVGSVVVSSNVMTTQGKVIYVIQE